MRRREFITLIGGAAAWPITTYAQQRDGQRRIGVLMTDEGSQGQARMAAFRQGLQQLGWTDGRNIRIDARWSGGDDAKMRKSVAELVALAPEVILATGSASMGPLMQISGSGTVPIVFVIVPDPVGAGYVDSPVMSTVWLGREATLPASHFSNTASAGNGWTCLSRSHRR